MKKKSLQTVSKNCSKHSISSKNGISPLVSTALLLVVTFTAIIGFQNWFGSYSSDIFSQVELESKDALTNDVKIKQLLSNVLYVTSDSSNNLSVRELKINGEKCLLSSLELESGMNEIPIINCLGNLTSPKIEVFLNTEQGTYSHYFYFEKYMMSSEAIVIPSLTFSSNDTGVDYGDNINLSWTSSNAINCSASGDWSGTKPVSGFEIQNNLIANMTYNLNCSSEDGSTLRTVNVNVGAPPAPALIFNSNDTAIAYDTSINLSWSATDSTSCIASGDWSGAKSLQGNEVIEGINSTRTFNLTCSGVGGTIEQLVTVNVAAASDCIGPDSSVVLHGNSKTFYLASSVPYNQVCTPETRTCYNGNLNGTYSNPSCVINNCPFGTIMGLCSICDGAGIASTQAPVDDASCGIIDCDGLDNYYITGTQGATTTSYCNFDNYADLSSARCKAEFDCKDPNSADCGSPVTTTPNTAGTCQYIAGCTGSTPGSVVNYNTATACSGTLDCDVNNYYHITGTQGATTTSYCKYEDYADTTRKCNGAGSCAALNCGTPVQSNQATAGVCKYISGCTGGSAGVASNYVAGTSCGAGMQCNGAGSCVSGCPAGYSYLALRNRCESLPSCSSGTYNSVSNKCETVSYSSYAATLSGGISFTKEVAGWDSYAYQHCLNGYIDAMSAYYSNKGIGCTGFSNRIRLYVSPTPFSGSVNLQPALGTTGYASATSFSNSKGLKLINDGWDVWGYGASVGLSAYISTISQTIGGTYTCPSGGVLSGTTCDVTTINQINPTCSGGNLDTTNDKCYANFIY